MKAQKTLSQSILWVAGSTALLLAIPLVAMQFTNEVDWSLSDFIIMGALLFGTGLAYVSVTRFASNMASRVAFGLAIGTCLLMIWANLAVGLIGSGPNLANMMYMGVVAVGIIGSIRARFQAKGMERAMYATAFALVLLAVITLLTNTQASSGSSVAEIIGVNGFFAALFAISGSLFRLATQASSVH